MITYEQIKVWLKEKENKHKIVIGVCFVVVFLVGFGAGSYDKNLNHNKLQSNYSSFQAKKPAPVVSKEGDGAGQHNNNNDNNKALKTATITPVGSCLIKGNISSSGKKIYHMQGGAFYKKVKPEQCFFTETDAQAAGFIKSTR